MFLESVINFNDTDTSTVGVRYIMVLIVIKKKQKHDKPLYKKNVKKIHKKNGKVEITFI